jgi:hypothetical protein
MRLTRMKVSSSYEKAGAWVVLRGPWHLGSAGTEARRWKTATQQENRAVQSSRDCFCYLGR